MIFLGYIHKIHTNKNIPEKPQIRYFRYNFIFLGHDLNVGKLRYIIFLFQNSKKSHVGYVVTPLHMKGLSYTEKKALSLDTSRYFTFYIIFNLIFDFKKLHKVFMCCFFIFPKMN